MIVWIGIWLLFLVGIRLSAFFSGIETAFYRASKLRLNIDAQTGDVLSKRIFGYVSDPSRFVATILIGNNLANYVTTCAIGYGAIRALGSLSESTEVGVTVLLSPVIFIFGELLPKTLHYRAPLMMLKRYFRFFEVIHFILLPLSWPLIMLTKVFQKFGGTELQPMLRILGRRPLASVIGQGRDEGIVTDVQHNLMQGIFVNANKSIQGLIVPKNVAFRFDGELSQSNLLEYAKAFGQVYVPVVTEGANGPEPVYFRVSDLLLSRAPLHEIQHKVPRINSDASRLEALLILQESEQDLGAVYKKGKLVGIIYRMALSETLYQGGMSVTATVL